MDIFGENKPEHPVKSLSFFNSVQQKFSLQCMPLLKTTKSVSRPFRPAVSTRTPCAIPAANQQHCHSKNVTVETQVFTD